MLEKDLYGPVRDWMKSNGYMPKAEVKGCDILAVKDDIVLAVELKTTLNLEVILQAVDRQRIADMVYIAVPRKGRLLFTKRWKMICHLIKRLEIGLLSVSIKDGINVEEIIPPLPFDRARSRANSQKKRKAVVMEYQKRHGDYNTGGTNKVKLMTSYREKALVIAYLLSINGPMSPKQLRALGTDKNKTLPILSKNYYGWFMNISRGIYGLSEKGGEALSEYRELVSELCGSYREKS